MSVDIPDPVTLEPLAVAATPASVVAALPAYRGFLAGSRSILPVTPDNRGRHLSALMDAGSPGTPVTAGTLVACTSGSTGVPKGALLQFHGVQAAIDASASVLRDRTGAGPGPWLLALPPHHIAGTMVILRSLAAGHDPQVLEGASSTFTGNGFVAATRRLAEAHPGLPRYTSLVPTQLARLLDAVDRTGETDADGTAVDALRSYAAILIGGGAAPAELLDRCHRLGVPVVLTYGSSETAGGVVYDGTPLPGFEARINGDSAGHYRGRIELTGPSVASGYRHTSALPAGASVDAFPRPGTFRTSDLGFVRDGVLTVRGRSDGAVNSAGLKILPEDVEKALDDAGFSACVTGVPDAEWGEAVAALIADPTVTGDTDVTEAVRSAMKTVTPETPSHLIPRYAFTTPSIPLTGPGKPDRQLVKRKLATLTAAPAR